MRSKLSSGFYVGAVAGLVLASACGGSGGRISTDSTREGLASAARGYTEAFFASPSEAYDYFSDACHESMSSADFAGQLLLASAFFESSFGFPLEEAQVTAAEVVDFDGETGTVRVTIAGPDGKPIDDEAEPQRWRYEGDRWVTDDCDSLDADSGFGDGTES